MPIRLFLLLLPCILTAWAAPLHARVGAGAHASLTLLATSDLHANVLGYDYYKLAPDPSFGLERTATLVAQARREFANTLLLDSGDAIEGNALADYQANVAVPPCDAPLTIYQAMNALGYDGGTVGNHEFNYGLPYLNRVTGSAFEVDGVEAGVARCAGPRFPLVLANVYSARTHAPLFAPYHIIDKHIVATSADGRAIDVVVRVGIIGFTTPRILAWDKRWLDGRLYTEGMVESARKYVPQLRAQGADVIVALAHAGLDDAPYVASMENAAFHLARVPGIDALLIGHTHQVFPDARGAARELNAPGVDKVSGTVHGVPTVMPGFWGKHLGLIGLQLVFDGSRWVVDKSKNSVQVRSTALGDGRHVAPDPAFATLSASAHASTLAYVRTPLATTEFRLSTYFADVGDTSAIDVVNLAQTDYLTRYVRANLPSLAQLPVLSMSAPFKSGAAGPADYTDVRAGPLALNNAADLYLYPNTLSALIVDGVQLKQWLEHAARRFNTIDPLRTEAQELINPAFAGYNFDVATAPELEYEIDVTKAPGARIVNLRFRGAPPAADQQFLVATNNYRASGGGGFPGLSSAKVVLDAPDANRDVLMAYLRSARTLTRTQHETKRRWRFARVVTAGAVVFHCAPGMIGLAHDAGLGYVSLVREDDKLGKGMALYRVDLSRPGEADPAR